MSVIFFKMCEGNQGIFPVILLQQVRIALNCTSLALLNSSCKGDRRFPLKDSFTLCKLDFMLLTELVLIGMSYTIHWFRWNHKSAAVLMPSLIWRCGCGTAHFKKKQRTHLLRQAFGES